jgi:CPA2 family monovalent cation:H+ antiporter-2
MSAASFLQDLAVVLATAALALAVFKRAGLPPVLGYLAAGLLVGPHTPGILILDPHGLEVLAEIGVVFLLFALGVEFNFERLARVGARALAAAAIEAGALLLAGAGTAAVLGWNPLEGLLLGGVMSIAGTAIVARTLLERTTRPPAWGELVSGILIAEDLIAVLLIAFFSSAAPGAVPGPGALAATAARFAGLVAAIVAVGRLLLPRVLAAVERVELEEVRTLAVVAACFGSALLTEKLGYSAALGAFLGGAAASGGGAGAERLRRAVAPLRDVFGAVFFVSIGMLIDPRWLVARWPLALGVSALAVAVRAAGNFLALRAVGQASAAAAAASAAMLPIGEFSFILAQLARGRGLTERPLEPLAVAICLVTTLASAVLLPMLERRTTTAP